MTWLLTNWRIVLAFLLVALIAGLLLLAAHYRDSTLRVEQQRDAAIQQTKSAEAVTNNVISAVRLFNDIAAATQGQKQRTNTHSENRIVVIRKAVETDKCAALSVPATAADELRTHRNQIRSGSASPDPGKSDRRLPGTGNP
ncbi:DUF2570 domain-containing protein [Pantoea ananatis]|uniref:DUF2570 domain-containing protein n=1 Tax=Pantoea ananas TaxID=553 RepID=UPI001F4E4606|nr:DUF2570 domain-containing protein [Pantoea ananatis]MCH9269670.1 DUF2570 domain-containing protein [Pantoea ananatis]